MTIIITQLPTYITRHLQLTLFTLVVQRALTQVPVVSGTDALTTMLTWAADTGVKAITGQAKVSFDTGAGESGMTFRCARATVSARGVLAWVGALAEPSEDAVRAPALKAAILEVIAGALSARTTETCIIVLTIRAIVMLITVTLIRLIRQRCTLAIMVAGIAATRVIELAFGAKVPQRALAPVVTIGLDDTGASVTRCSVAAVEVLTQLSKVVRLTHALVSGG